MRDQTRLIPTEREPACDIRAQLIALLAPDHPKRAVWISHGTKTPVDLLLTASHRIKRLDLPTGTLYASEHDCGRLEDDPSEEMLANLLDYVMPKSACRDSQGWAIFVVQARDAENRVVLEMVVDIDHLGDAVDRCRLYGEPRVLSMHDCLLRRRDLISREDAARR